jgi:hypothetical protein
LGSTKSQKSIGRFDQRFAGHAPTENAKTANLWASVDTHCPQPQLGTLRSGAETGASSAYHYKIKFRHSPTTSYLPGRD